MCAMIPMFRTLSMATGRSCIFSATFISLSTGSARKLCCFRPSGGSPLCASPRRRCSAQHRDLERELLGHTLPPAVTRETVDPATGEREPALRPDLDRDLVCGAANAPGLDLEEWRGVAKRLVEDLQRLLLGLLRCTRQRVVDDLLRGRALAFAHDHVHELGDRLRLVYGVRRDDTFDGTVATRHQAAALPFSRFAPYFDRAFLRFLVPAVSSVPRMM